MNQNDTDNRTYNNMMLQNNEGMTNNQPLNNSPVIINQATTEISNQQNVASRPVVSNEILNENNVQNNNFNNNKKSRKTIVIILSIVILLIICACIMFFLNGKSKNVSEGTETWLARETYKNVYSDENGVSYFVNNEEKIYSFSNEYNLGDSFYRNVNYGYNLNYEYFLIDINNKYIVDPGVYDYIRRINGIYYLVEKDDYYGVIDYKGNLIINTEYLNVNYYDDDDGVGIFSATNKSNDEYYLYSINGSLILKSSEEINEYDFDAFAGKCKKCLDTILYNNTLYDAINGGVLLENVSGSLFYNFYHDANNNKLIVYDQQYKVKKQFENVENVYFYSFQGRYPAAEFSHGDLYLNENLELIDVELEYEKFIKKNGFVEMKNIEYHVLANGEKYITQIDEETNSIIIYDSKGKKLKSAFVGSAKYIHDIYTEGNYFIVIYGFGDDTNVLTTDGEFIVKNANYETYYDVNNILTVNSDEDGDILLHDNFKLEFTSETEFFMHDKGFFAYDPANDIVTLYNLNGNESKKIENILYIFELADNYLLCRYDTDKYKVIDTNGNVTLDFEKGSDYSYVPYKYYNDNIGVIEMIDGIYTLSGKKIIDKK